MVNHYLHGLNLKLMKLFNFIFLKTNVPKGEYVEPYDIRDTYKQLRRKYDKKRTSN